MCILFELLFGLGRALILSYCECASDLDVCVRVCVCAGHDRDRVTMSEFIRMIEELKLAPISPEVGLVCVCVCVCVLFIPVTPAITPSPFSQVASTSRTRHLNHTRVLNSGQEESLPHVPVCL